MILYSHDRRVKTVKFLLYLLELDEVIKTL